MKQEDAELLLRDLCARLPYKVIVDYSYNVFNIHNGNYVKHVSKCILTCYLLDIFMSPRQNENGEYIKPYLRPLSSMTEKEIEEFSVLGVGIHLFKGPLIPSYDTLDWLNKKMFDYRGLIPKGLALEAPEGMYKHFGDMDVVITSVEHKDKL